MMFHWIWCAAGSFNILSGDVGAVDTRVEGVVEVVVWVATEGTEPVGEAVGHVGFVWERAALE